MDNVQPGVLFLVIWEKVAAFTVSVVSSSMFFWIVDYA